MEVALEACEKFNQEFEGIFDGLEQINETHDNLTIDELKTDYDQNNIDNIRKTLKKKL